MAGRAAVMQLAARGFECGITPATAPGSRFLATTSTSLACSSGLIAAQVSVTPDQTTFAPPAPLNCHSGRHVQGPTKAVNNRCAS
jgi:hypothetical protein